MENSNEKYVNLLDKLEKHSSEYHSDDSYFFEKKLSEFINFQERKRLGQFSTPINVAKFMALWGINDRITFKYILDPSIGCGTLVQQVINLFLQTPTLQPLTIHGYDIDPLMIRTSKLRFSNTPSNFKISFFNEDFLLSPINQLYDLIIANPPYVKSNKIINKDIYFQNLENEYAVKLDGTTGLDCLFLLKAIKHLNINGRIVFITPSEFLNSSYGRIIKSLLMQNLQLDAMIYFDIKENKFVFEDGMSSALITLATKTNINNDSKIKLVKIVNLSDPNQLLNDLNKNTINYPNTLVIKDLKDMDAKEKWIPTFNKVIQSHSLLKKFVSLSEFFEVKRGIATGNNTFFTLTQNEVKKWNIPSKYLTPVLTKASYVAPLVFTEENFIELVNRDKKTFLLNINEENPSDIEDYLKFGVSRGVDQKYLTRHRKKWFFVEKREPAPIFVKVFNRGDVQFILNRTNVLNLTCFHGIYPRKGNILYCKALIMFFLTTVGKKLINLQLRHYGGGLKKLEPKDVENILIPDFRLCNQRDLHEIDDIFETCIRSKSIDTEKMKTALYHLYKINQENFSEIQV